MSGPAQLQQLQEEEEEILLAKVLSMEADPSPVLLILDPEAGRTHCLDQLPSAGGRLLGLAAGFTMRVTTSSTQILPRLATST